MPTGRVPERHQRTGIHPCRAGLPRRRTRRRTARPAPAPGRRPRPTPPGRWRSPRRSRRRPGRRPGGPVQCGRRSAIPRPGPAGRSGRGRGDCSCRAGRYTSASRPGRYSLVESGAPDRVRRARGPDRRPGWTSSPRPRTTAVTRSPSTSRGEARPRRLFPGTVPRAISPTSPRRTGIVDLRAPRACGRGRRPRRRPRRPGPRSRARRRPRRGRSGRRRPCTPAWAPRSRPRSRPPRAG